MNKNLKPLTVLLTAAALTVTGARAHEHDEPGAAAKTPASPGTVTVKGEVIDLVCYVDHNATGAKHAACAKTCIESGLPVGLKGEDGKTYLLVGEHKPANKELAAYAAKTVTIRGKLVTRDGIAMLENIEVVKSSP